MADPIWSQVEQFFGTHLFPEDEALEQCLRASDAAGLPAIQVSPALGKYLQLMVRLSGGVKVLELGTLGGYSTIWMARGLAPAGKLITIDIEAKHTEVARENVSRAGLVEKVEFRTGPCLDILPQLEAERAGPFDLIFIDADKANMADYFTSAVKLARPGSLIICDNVVRQGRITEEDSDDPSIRGVQEMRLRLAREPRAHASLMQTVGPKGHDGFLFILVSE